MAACSSDGNNTTTASEPGILSLALTDAFTDQYQAVYVTVDEIQVHMGGDEEEAGNWETVATPGKTYNLLELVNGTVESLGVSPLEAGTYEQMRLIIGLAPSDGLNILSVGHPYANYAIDMDDLSHELKIPSGINTGIKIVHSFDIGADQTTELILDFDASASVVQAGNSGNWLLKPTIKVLDTEEYAIIAGTVYDSESAGIEGAVVSLQYETSDAEDEKDAVMVQTATVSDVEDADAGTTSGEFSLLAEPGSYRLVSYKDGYGVGCAVVDAVAGETAVQDVVLGTSDMGTVEGTVTINGGTSEQYATLSFRQAATCEGTDQEGMIEVRSVNSVTGFWYDIDLPVGTYSLVASSSGMETEVYEDIEVTDGGIFTQHVNLAP